MDLFRELLEEGKGVTRSNKEYEEEKRQEKVSRPRSFLSGMEPGEGALCPQVPRTGGDQVSQWRLSTD